MSVRCRLVFAFFVALISGSTVLADPVVPKNILNPTTAAEAWNVIWLATKNVDQLLDENRPSEIPVQISFCSPALRALPAMATIPDAVEPVRAAVARAFVSVNAIASSARQNNQSGTRAALASLRERLDEIARHFDEKVVAANIYVCPIHPEFASESGGAPCATCGMRLIPRRIPYSFIYVRPGEPTVSLTATVSAPIDAGKRIEVKLRMEKADKSPVVPADLLVMHTQPIHLLIEDPALNDYHHEQPVTTATPGEYVFSFIPARTTPYRIWADLVPAATGVQELPFVDLPSIGKPSELEKAENRFASEAGGYRFALSFGDGNDQAIKATQARPMFITIADAEGTPVTTLEPVMNAFAHLVGFYDDYRTVVHLHPTGGDVLDAARRGGPSLGFLFFAPQPGFIRLYCQVKVEGRTVFAPFNVNVEP